MTLGAQCDPKMLYEYLLLKRPNSSSFYVKNNNSKLILKFIWKCKGTRIAKTVLETNKVGQLALSNFKNYCEKITK